MRERQPWRTSSCREYRDLDLNEIARVKVDLRRMSEILITLSSFYRTRVGRNPCRYRHHHHARFRVRQSLRGGALEDTAYPTKPTLQNLDEPSNLPAPPQLRRAPRAASSQLRHPLRAARTGSAIRIA